jgi:hypothetical protein
LALLRTKLHFGLLQLLDVFEVGSQLFQSLTSQPGRMLNALLSLPAVAGESFRSLDLTSKRHLKELRLDRKSVRPSVEKNK